MKGSIGVNCSTIINTRREGSKPCASCEHLKEGIHEVKVKRTLSKAGKKNGIMPKVSYYGYKCDIYHRRRKYNQWCVCKFFKKRKTDEKKVESIYLN
jgi:hypothetical protein